MKCVHSILQLLAFAVWLLMAKLSLFSLSIFSVSSFSLVKTCVVQGQWRRHKSSYLTGVTKLILVNLVY